MRKNSPQVWDKVWADPGLVKADALILKTEAATIRWRRIKTVLLQEFGSLQGLQILEIGSGIGTYAALLAQGGADATLLDYSAPALARARDFFAANQLQVHTVQADAFNLPPALLKKKFDVAISVGLTEHFLGKKRLQINKIHLDVLKKNGLAIVIVPNQYNPPYRIFKAISEILGTWKFGEEYPYSRRELLAICDKIGGQVVALVGDDLYSSLKFLLPANFLRRLLGVGLPLKIQDIRHEKGSFLDNYLSYCLILMMKKAPNAASPSHKT